MSHPAPRSDRGRGRSLYIAALVLALLAGSIPLVSRAVGPARVAPPTVMGATQAAKAYAKLPLRFELNQGQTDPKVAFLSRGHGSTLFLTRTEAVVDLVKPQANPSLAGARSLPIASHKLQTKATTVAALHLGFVGANAKALAVGLEQLPGVSNYFIGNDPKRWHTNVPSYAEVQLRGLYPGIDLFYYGSSDGSLEYDWEVGPGADPGVIRLAVSGTDQQLSLDSRGGLVLHTAAGTVVQHAPSVYQTVGGARRSILGRYVLLPGGQVGVSLGSYDHSKALVIDPVLAYSTYLGGTGDDGGTGIAVDTAGDAYVTGWTNSTDFPTTGPVQGNSGGGSDVFVSKLNSAGSALVYSTYLGGAGADSASGIAVDGAGNAYVTGDTTSTNFPTWNALQAANGGGHDAFVTKLNAAGSSLVYSTYLGGSGDDFGKGIAVDTGGNAYITGYTTSTDFPNVGAFQRTSAGGDHAFVTKLSASGSALAYSTYLGGTGYDEGHGIAVDRTGDAYITGTTTSTNFPTWNALQAANGGGHDAFVTKLNPAGSALIYSTYLGGSSYDEGDGIAVDSTGEAYITGYSLSSDFPTANAFQGGNHTSGYLPMTAFVTKLDSAGTAFVYSTYLGGSSRDQGTRVAVDGVGNAYITGYTTSGDFPTANALQGTNGGGYDAFVTKFNPSGSALIYSTYLGGTLDESGNDIAVDRAGNGYITGVTASTDFPTVKALQGTKGGGYDAFVTKIANSTLPSQPIQPPLVGGNLRPPETKGTSNPSAPKICHCYAADPVDPATGNFTESATDIAIPGRGIPLSFNRTYNTLSASTNGPLGYGWTFATDASLSVDRSTGAVTITQENGSQVVFTLSGSAYVPAAPRDVATLVHNGDGTWTMTRLAKEKLSFSSTGQLISQSDLNGYTTRLTYTAGRLSTVTDAAGRTLTLGYSGTHLTSVTDQATPTPRRVLFGYNDRAGNLTDVTDVLGNNTHYTYDPSHLLLTMRDQRGHTATNHYDSSGRVDYQLDKLNRKTAFAYAPDGSWATVTDPQGNVTLQQYQHGVVTALTLGYGTPQQATSTFLYDPATLGLTTTTDPNGHTTTATYDARGNLLTTTDALGRKTTNTYDSLNDLLTTTDPTGATTTMTYDARGNLLTRSRPAARGTGPVLIGSPRFEVTTYVHGDAAHPGDVTAVIDPLGKTSRLSYDRFGDVSSTVDPQGNRATSSYNSIGWLLTTVSPKGNVAKANPAAFTTSFDHDAVGRVTLVTDPLRHKTSSRYDADGNLLSSTDAGGHVTGYTHDAANQLTATRRADGTTIATAYNLDGTVAAQIDGAGKVTTYAYDALRRVTSVTDSLRRTTRFSYDLVGNRLTLTDPQGQVTTSTYDAGNQLTSMSYSDGKTPAVTGITYDPAGRMTAMTDGTGTSTWSWDSLGRLTRSRDGSGATVAYGYDLRDQLTTLTYPSGKVVTRSYDAAGHLTSVTDWLGNKTSFGYDPNSNLVTTTLPAATGVVDSSSFDHADRLMKMTDFKGAATLASFTYGRDGNGQVSSAAETGVPGVPQSYTYNALNELAAVNAKPYGYDDADNVTKLLNGSTLAYDAGNQLTTLTQGTATTTFSYDQRGNRTSAAITGGATSTLGYDQANRLTSFGTTGTTATYQYNGSGLRTAKTVGTTTTAFTWDLADGLPLLISDGARAYVYGPGGLPLEMVVAGKVSWYHHDQLGSTRMLTDGAGKVVSTATYDVYGKLVRKTGTSNNPLMYAGEYRNAESGMYYLRARYYDPATAQFVSRDPLVATTRSAYGYVAGNPLNGTDPTGLYQYHYSYAVGSVQDTGGHSAVAKYLKENLASLFPFDTGGCSQVQQGQSCNFHPFVGVDDPLYVSGTCDNGFTLKTTSDNRDIGPNGTIAFSIYDQNGQVYLDVNADAPNATWYANLVGPIVAAGTWGTLASRLADHFNHDPVFQAPSDPGYGAWEWGHAFSPY